ncbi:MAG: c-type cytochrome biogenesis protein CcmI, partial [Pseudomonadota bacterium]
MTVALFAALFRGTASGRSGDPDLAVYKDQLRSVERDVARGVVAEEEAERLRLEIKRRILEADRAAPQGSLGQAPKSATIAAGALVLLALLGGSLLGYTYLGTPGYGDLPLERRLALAASARENRPGQADAESQAPQPENPEVSPEYAALMDRLRAAVAERPDDARGLELLAENEARL